MQNAYLEQSFKFAQAVDKEMKGGTFQHSRGISQDAFYVLWRTAMPSVLIECGFLSNSADREALITEKGRARIASDIYDAFKIYKKEYDGSDAVKGSVKAKSTGSESSVAEDGVTEVSVKEAASIVYGTQVLVSSKSMPGNDPFFKGYDVIKMPAGRLFKYIIGYSSDLNTAKEMNRSLSRDFKDSFLVKVENHTAERLR